MYSEAEVRLFQSLTNNTLNDYYHYHNAPYLLYKAILEDLFLENRQGADVDKFRKAYKKVFVEASMCRLTPEFETLLES